jgi:hypothetical protein
MTTTDQVVDGFHVDDHRLTLPASVAGVVTVSFDGRYVWSFRPQRDARPGPGGVAVSWPASLHPHLRGRTRLTLAEPGTGRTYVDQEVALGGGTERIRLEDPHGHPLAVNKVGNLTRVFAETDDAARAEILRGTAHVLDDLREHGGVDAYLNYGCLLGAVREGRMIGTDCDADLCYLSERTHPADVIRESYALERAMLARGWRTVRMSGGDFKVLLRLGDRRTVYVDVFAAFYVDGVFYQLGNRSGDLPRSAITPTSTIVLEGVVLPAPADPEAMLAFVYGPGWRVPDPSFKFTDPPGGVRRLDGWLRGYRDDLPGWNAFLGGPQVRDVPKGRSDFAFFARQGHPVHAYEVSPEGRSRTQRRLRRSSATSVVRRLVLGELRTVAVTGAEIGLLPGRRHVYARHLVNALDDEARRNLWRLGRMALAGDLGSLFLEVSATGPGLPAGVEPAGLAQRVDADRVVAELESHGARVEERYDGPGTDVFDRPDPRTCRLRVTFPRASGATRV